MAETGVRLTPSGFFEARAEAYDSELHRPFYEEAAGRLLGLLPPDVQPASILEVGAGTGFATRLLLDRFPDARVTALEPSAKMAERGRTNAADAEWICRDLADFDGGRFDLVVASMSYHWLTPYERRKLARIAVGGTAALAIPIAGGQRLDGNMALLKLVRQVSARNRWKRESRRLQEAANLQMAYFPDVRSDRFYIQERFGDPDAFAESLDVRGVLPALFGEMARTAREMLSLSVSGPIAFNWELGLVVAADL